MAIMRSHHGFMLLRRIFALSLRVPILAIRISKGMDMSQDFTIIRLHFFVIERHRFDCFIAGDVLGVLMLVKCNKVANDAKNS